jgi:zinc transporter ZupT
MIILVALLAFSFSIIGGLVGLRYRDKLHLVLGYTAGVLLAVVAFDIFPELIEQVELLGIEPTGPMIALVIGFLLFHIFEKLLLIHKADDNLYGPHKHPVVGVASALAISGHSFLDGIGVGLGFQVSTEIGILLAVAVVAHNFSDGLNTMSLALMHKNPVKRSMYLLMIDALAPVLGILVTLFFTIPTEFLVYYLGFFAGFLLYIGASEILPEAHHEHSSIQTILMTILGVVSIYLVTILVHSH